MFVLRKALIPAAVAFASLCAGQASAQSSWVLDTSRASIGTSFSGLNANQCGQRSTNANNYGNVWDCKSGTGQQQLTASAWSTSNGAGTTVYNGRYSSGSWQSSTSRYRTVFQDLGGGSFSYRTYDNGALISTVNSTTNVPAPNLRVSQHQQAPATGSWFSNAIMNDQGTSGFGATNRAEAIQSSSGGNHAFDSISPGLSDMILLQFDAATVLDQFRMGWIGTDGDISILRWTGDTAPSQLASPVSTAVTGDSELNLSAQKFDANTDGWVLMSHFGDVGTGTINTGFTEGSSWWLISTYNTTLANNVMACKNANNTNCSTGDDAFKIEFLKATNYTCPGTPTPGGNCTPPDIPGVPLPGSISLAGLGLAGLALHRRRRANLA